MDVPLYWRRELPPSRAGAVKPIHIPEAGAGEYIAGLFGELFDRIEQTRSINERAELHGFASKAQLEADSIIAANPAMPPEQIKKTIEEAWDGVKKFAGKATTTKGKSDGKIFLLKNEAAFKQNAVKHATRITNENSLLRLDTQIDRLIATGAKGLDALNTLIDDHTGPTKLLSREKADAIKFAGYEQMEKVQDELDKAEHEALYNVALAAVQEEPDRAEEIVKEYKLDAKQRSNLLQEGRVLANNRRAQADRAQKELWDQTETEAWKRLRDPEKHGPLTYDFIKEQEDLGAWRRTDRDRFIKVLDDKAALEKKRQTGLAKLWAEKNANTIRRLVTKMINDGTMTDAILEDAAATHNFTGPEYDKFSEDLKEKQKAQEIVSDPQVRQRLLAEVTGIITGARDRDEVIKNAHIAHFVDKTLTEDDFIKIETQANARYLTAYTREVSRAVAYANGLLLNPDSLGYIRNAPVRYKMLGDWQEEFNNWIADKGETLDIDDIYIQGRKLAAMHQVSDERAEELEEQMNEQLKVREETRKFGHLPMGPFPEGVAEPPAKPKAKEPTDEELPHPKTQEEYDALPSGTLYVDTDGVRKRKR